MSEEYNNTDKTTEALILKAAEREFVEKGFAGARTTSIAEAAGVTHGMLHYYFRTKEKLFERIAKDKVSMLGEIFFGFLRSEGGGFVERVAEAVGRHFDFVAANRDMPLFIFSELSRDGHLAGFIADEFRHAAATIVSELQRNIDVAWEAGECCRMDAVMLMSDIVSLNVFPFVAARLIGLTGLTDDFEGFLASRRRENIELITKRLQP